MSWGVVAPTARALRAGLAWRAHHPSSRCAVGSAVAGRSTLALCGDVAIVLVIAWVAFASLKAPQLEYLGRPFNNYLAVLPVTAWAALKVWAFWGATATVTAGLLLRRAPRLGVLDATLAGGVAPFVFAWLGGHLLGPIGLYRPWTIWLLLAIAAWSLWRRPPVVPRVALTPGLTLALATFVLIGPVMLIEQLGSPVPTFMDVLATPAGAQRIMTFGVYYPFDNDPYGYFGPSSQLPGLELFYALLGLGSHTTLALLADTAAIVPMAAMLILATFRLGRLIGGDVAGGMATLFLLATVLFRTLPYMHGRTVSFVLLGTGLAFVLDERRNATRLCLGGIILGTTIGTHAVMGALGMLVVASTVLLWLLGGEFVATVAGVVLLAGASLVAAPEVAIGLRMPLPYPVLPVLQALGIVLVWRAACVLERRVARDRARWLCWALALFVIYALLWHPPWVMINNHHIRFPLAVYAGGVGVALMLAADAAAALRRRGGDAEWRVRLGPVVVAMVIGMGIEHASRRWAGISSHPEVRVAITDWFWKVDYWYPWILAFPAGCLAAWVYRRVSPRLAVFAVLALLFIPWRDHIDPGAAPDSLADPNYTQHTVVEAWVYALLTAKGGYWGSTGDTRWAQTPAELAMIDVLRAEIAAGRITAATRVVQIEPEYVLLYKDYLMYSVYTGIHGDPYVDVGGLEYDRSSRLQPIEKVYVRLAERPSYVAIRGAPALPPGALDGYVTLFDRDGVRLLRAASLG